MNSISEKNFQMVVKYGPIALAICLLVNIWVVMRYREVYRDSVKSEVQLQQLLNGERVLEGVLQDFSAHANSDPHVAEILRNAQAATAAPATGQRTQH